MKSATKSECVRSCRNGAGLPRHSGATTAGGNWTSHAYYHADGNGNITYLVNSNRTLAASYRYDPFGNLISKSGPYSDANVYRFSSKELHLNSGLYYYLYRFYSPSWQRWINRDPIQEQPGFQTRKHLRLQALAGWNLYEFCFNDPCDLADMDGRSIIGDIWSEFKHMVSAGLGGVGLGGRCCNYSSKDIWYVDDGEWHPLLAGKCSGFFVDCDGFMCAGKFYSVSTGTSGGCGDGCIYRTLLTSPTEMPIPNKRVHKPPPADWPHGPIAMP